MTKHFVNERGFTLVEVLVAITLLLMVIVGPMKILATANHSSSFATEQITAWFLAQEGLELAQHGRDNYLLQYFNKLNGGNGSTVADPWNQFKTGTYASCFTATGCGLVALRNGTTEVTDCSDSTKTCKLYLDTKPNNSVVRSNYQHDPTGAELTPYTRVVTMQQVGSKPYIAATSTVTWRSGSLIAGQKVETATYLFNIYETD